MVPIDVRSKQDVVATDIRLGAGAWSSLISPFGAELTSLRHDEAGEFIWQAGDDSWRRQAPLLFPTIGRYPDGLVRIGSAALALPPHGFAPVRSFTVLEQHEASCRMELVDDDETRALYPFAFRLTVDFVLGADGLDMTIEVHNPSADTVLPFMLGGHPGFVWPLPGAGEAEAHRLWFSETEQSQMVVLAGAADAGDRTFSFDGRVAEPAKMDFFGLTHALSPVRSDRVTFGTEAVHVALSYEGFANLAIWRRDTAPFLCLEPWTNLPIAVDRPTQFADLPDIERLEPGRSRRFSMRIAPGGTKLGGAPQS
ncbi:hypothetical protein [Devosia riboflavina]|uniref:aldose epimerase family protein n=1 Tax=Devosia riboflavina TaxID=46914 RepID=UPI0009FC4FDE|nr:hypothetical protein [Devosia riboflavina]